MVRVFQVLDKILEGKQYLIAEKWFGPTVAIKLAFVPDKSSQHLCGSLVRPMEHHNRVLVGRCLEAERCEKKLSELLRLA